MKQTMKNSGITIRVNGRGNAWPVFIGKRHPFYSTGDPDDLGNVSFSIFGTSETEFSTRSILWSLLVDAGNNIPSYIIRNENRIPDALFVTHPHLDHTLGIDWIAESYYYTHNKSKKYPLYATLPCWNEVRNSYGQLESIIEYKELIPGIKRQVGEVAGIMVTALPVFHGESGFGASMLIFEFNAGDETKTTAVFSGDMLCPLIRNADFKMLSEAKILYIDCNNRFSYPLSTHGSFVSKNQTTGTLSKYMVEYLDKLTFTQMMAPHLQKPYNDAIHDYFNEFLSENSTPGQLPFSVIDFVRRTHIPDIGLIHYSGGEDEKYSKQNVVSDSKLEEWARGIARDEGLKTRIAVPRTGDLFRLV